MSAARLCLLGCARISITHRLLLTKAVHQSTGLSMGRCPWLFSSNSLDSLIMRLVEDADDLSDIATINSIGTLKKIYAIQKGPISGDTSAKILSRYAALINGNSDMAEGTEWLKSGPLMNLDESVKNATLSLHSVLNALSAIISLDLVHEPIYDTLLDLLQQQFRGSPPQSTVSSIVQFVAVVYAKKVRLPEDLFKKIRELLKLKASEITSPEDIVSVLLCCNKNDIWFNTFVEKAKCSISAMSAGELVGMIASLAKNSCRPMHILRMICAAFDQKKQGLTSNQLITLAQSTAKLRFMDGRIRRVLVEETYANISRFTKWSQINPVVEALVKLRVGDSRAWRALAAWINNNQMNASLLELSFALHWCAIIGVGDLVQDAMRLFGGKLNIVNNMSPKTWLSAVYTLGICNCLNANLAQSVLQPKFIENAFERLNPWQKLMILTNIAQIQASLITTIDKGYQGSVIKIGDYMKMPPSALNEMAMRLRYGKSEEASVQHFHSLFHKLAPVNSHASPPTLNDDGVFVNAIIKLDVRANRFVRLDQFDEVQVPRLAVIFLSWRDKTFTCTDEEQSHLMGPISFSMHLLEKRGLVPVIFSQDDFDSNMSVRQQFESIKEKLEVASIGSFAK